MPRWTTAELEVFQQGRANGEQQDATRNVAARNAPTMRKAITPSEHSIQAAFIRWTQLAIQEYPALANLFAVPNGGMRPSVVDSKGKRYSTVARKLKAEGVKEGVPDLLLLIPRLGYHGLAIETKRPSGRVTPAQFDWHERLLKEGYYVTVCYSVDEMIAITTWYLNG